jgi:hypothetical protein
MINFNWWKWMLLGGAIGAMAMTLYAWSASAEARAELAVLEKKLQDQIALTDLASKLADEKEAEARAADEELARVRIEEETKRIALEMAIASGNRVIAGLREREQRIIGEIEILRQEILTAKPNIVADQIQDFMITDYPGFTNADFEYRGGLVSERFLTNEPGARAILSGFTDAAARVQIIDVLNDQRSALEIQTDELRGLATSLNTQLEFTDVDLERWKAAFTAKENEAFNLEEQIRTQTEMITVLEKKNFWEKIPDPVKAGMMFGIGLAVGSQLR